MPSLTIRVGRLSDADAIADVFSRAYRQAFEGFPELHSVADDRRFVENVILRNDTVHVAVLDGRVVGFAAYGWRLLEHFYVAPEVWRRGVGRALMASVKAARPNGLRLWCFQANTRARAFYATEGFRPLVYTDGSRIPERLPDLVLVWQPQPRRRLRSRAA